MKMVKILQYLILLFFIIACIQTNDTNINIDIFNNPDCVRACWEGLRLNETTARELRQFLETNNFVNIRLDEDFDNSYSLYLANHPDGYSFASILQSEILKTIEIFPTFGTTLTIGQIVDNLGEPEYVQLNYSPNEQRGNQLEGYINIYYPQAGYWFPIQGLAITQVSDDTVEICVNENNTARAIYLSVSSTINAMIGEFRFPIRDLLDENNLQGELNSLTSWSGFDCYFLPHFLSETK